MLRLTRKHSNRVSNRTAVIAACLLLVSSAAGLSGTFESATGQGVLADSRNAAVSEFVPEQNRRGRSFKVSLFLLRLK